MKKIAHLIIISFFILSIAPAAFIACTDVAGDGIDSVLYTGSTLSQNSSYRNPVWEPSFEEGTVFKGPTSFVAIGSETQWAKGITYIAPTLLSTNLMNWTFNTNNAFPARPDTVVSGTETIINKRPDWAEGRLHSMTAGFARTIVSTSYWLFYQLGETQAIGVASARSPQGPYTDYGMLLDNTATASTQLKNPYFFVSGTRFFLLYSTEQGSFVQELILRRAQKPTLRNAAIQVSGAGFTDVAMFRKGDFFYLFGNVQEQDRTRVHYARGSVVTGPFTDKEGNSLLTGNGILLIDNGNELINPGNVSGIFTDFTDVDFIMYTVTDTKKPVLESGFNRRPLMLNKITLSAEGWFDEVVKPAAGWTAPKYRDK